MWLRMLPRSQNVSMMATEWCGFLTIAFAEDTECVQNKHSPPWQSLTMNNV